MAVASDRMAETSDRMAVASDRMAVASDGMAVAMRLSASGSRLQSVPTRDLNGSQRMHPPRHLAGDYSAWDCFPHSNDHPRPSCTIDGNTPRRHSDGAALVLQHYVLGSRCDGPTIICRSEDDGNHLGHQIHRCI